MENINKLKKLNEEKQLKIEEDRGKYGIIDEFHSEKVKEKEMTEFVNEKVRLKYQFLKSFREKNGEVYAQSRYTYPEF